MREERGSITAEFAVVLPAVVLVLMLALAALQVAGRQVRLQAATADAARLAARHDGRAVGRVTAEFPGSSVSVRSRGELVCVTARAGAGPALLQGVTLSARACALAESPGTR